MKNLHYDIRKRDLLDRDIRVASIISEPEELNLAAVTDAKSLYDNLHQEQ